MGMIKSALFAGLFLCSSSALGLSQAAGEEPIRIGVISSLSGPFAQLGEDGVDGIKIALEEVGNKIGGREIQLFVEDDGADPSTAIEKVRALVNRDKVQLILGPLSGSAGQAVKDAADEWPNATIVVAGAAAEDITMRGIKPNVFRTSYTGAQPTFPLGDYAYKQGYRNVAIVAEDYAFPYAQVGGFMSTFCSLGGKVPKKFWVPIGTSDFSSIFPDLSGIDAVFVALGGTDAVNFFQQMEGFGLIGKVKILGGTVTVDATQLTSVGELLDGVVSASIMSGQIDTPAFKALDEKFRSKRDRAPRCSRKTTIARPSGPFSPSTTWAEGSRTRIPSARSCMRPALPLPASWVSFDQHHNVVTDVYLNQVKNVGGEWLNVPIRTYSTVGQFWTFDPKEYQAAPSYNRDLPACP
jgi:branched-chain amino acid transport system substrate-binding protein